MSWLLDELKENRRWIINCAVSFNGILSTKENSISNEVDWSFVHQLRNICVGIVIGANTVMVDNPSLRVQKKFIDDPVDHPIRVVLDRSSKLDGKYEVFNSKNTILLAGKQRVPGVIFLSYPGIEHTRKTVERQLGKMGKSGSVLVEGGGLVITNLLSTGQIELLRVYRSTRILQDGIPIIDPTKMDNITLSLLSVGKCGDGVEEIYRVNYS